MLKKHHALVMFLALILAICVARSVNASTHNRQKPQPVCYQRIVSTAPSITELLFALGLGDRVVGVTKYCNYPPAARKIAKIGGFVDPSLESIVRLRPDLVVVAGDRTDVICRLKDFHLNVLETKQDSINDILNNLMIIGRACSAGRRANSITCNIRQRIEVVRSKTIGRKKPRVLICIGMGGQPNDKVYVAGSKCFYDDLIRIAGGVNVCAKSYSRMPGLSKEGLIKLNPQVVIDFVPKDKAFHVNKDKELALWKRLTQIEAVRRNRVYVLTQEYLDIPGPRFINTLEDIARIIHPETEWKKQ